jgi:hypothetical protein
VQNANSLYVNNAICSITWRHKPLPESDRIKNNLVLPGRAAEWLVDPAHLDFRPRADSSLVDAGVVVKGTTEGYKGKAPDAGAYERKGRQWKPGAGWKWE